MSSCVVLFDATCVYRGLRATGGSPHPVKIYSDIAIRRDSAPNSDCLCTLRGKPLSGSGKSCAVGVSTPRGSRQYSSHDSSSRWLRSWMPTQRPQLQWQRRRLQHWSHSTCLTCPPFRILPSCRKRSRSARCQVLPYRAQARQAGVGRCSSVITEGSEGGQNRSPARCEAEQGRPSASYSRQQAAPACVCAATIVSQGNPGVDAPQD